MALDSLAFCCLTIVPVRADHSDTAEIVTQLFFGELVKIIDTHQQWVKTENLHDNYQGWVDRKQLLPFDKNTTDFPTDSNGYQQEEELTLLSPWGEQKVMQGSPILSSKTSFKINNDTFTWKSDVPTKSNKSIPNIALSYLNVPYLWGGRSQYGIDCSGFSQTVYHQAGLFIHRDASQQVLQGKEVAFEEQQEGDLAFFKSEISGKITHVGIVLSKGKIIHAHGRVRIDKLDKKGIYNEQENYYSHKFHNVKHYINLNTRK